MNFKTEIKNIFQKDLNISVSLPINNSTINIEVQSQKTPPNSKNIIIPNQTLPLASNNENTKRKISSQTPSKISRRSSLSHIEKKNLINNLKKKKKGRKAKESESLKEYFINFDYYFSKLYLLEFNKIFFEDFDSNSCLLISKKKIDRKSYMVLFL